MGFMDKLEKMAQASEQAVSGTGGYLSVRNMKVIDSWNMIVEQGAGKERPAASVIYLSAITRFQITRCLSSLGILALILTFPGLSRLNQAH